MLGWFVHSCLLLQAFDHHQICQLLFAFSPTALPSPPVAGIFEFFKQVTAGPEPNPAVSTGFTHCWKPENNGISFDCRSRMHAGFHGDGNGSHSLQQLLGETLPSFHCGLQNVEGAAGTGPRPLPWQPNKRSVCLVLTWETQK